SWREGILDPEVTRLQLDRTRIIFEQFEEETVLVNMDSGFYYSLSKPASEIVKLLDEGCPVADLGKALFSDPEDAGQFRGPIDAFVAELQRESILIAREEGRPSRVDVNAVAALYPSGASYALPELERFDDVRDLLLIDPVHQVDREYGWPSTSPESALEPKA
ncbi:MAG: PqqD family protein, partial [Acidobacteriota bacterium]